MQLIVNESTDPAFNLALEEHALTGMDIELIMLWRNARSVIVGNNQNALEEIDIDFVRERDIPVIRRQSGGGAVFHDLGNVNFTVIHALGNDDFNNYAKFTAPIVAFLRTLGVAAELQGRNDLVIDGRKFCGNAQAVRKGRIMHHGCILYSANFSDLAGALRPRPVKIESKGVKSVRKRVTNIADHMRGMRAPLPVEEFFRRLSEYFAGRADMERYALTPADVAATHRLVAEKYGTWEWNFGKSPAYNFENLRRYPFGIVEARLQIERGDIREAHIYGDFFGRRDKAELEALLRGIRHERAALRSALAAVDVGDYISGMEGKELVDLLY